MHSSLYFCSWSFLSNSWVFDINLINNSWSLNDCYSRQLQVVPMQGVKFCLHKQTPHVADTYRGRTFSHLAFDKVVSVATCHQTRGEYFVSFTLFCLNSPTAKSLFLLESKRYSNFEHAFILYAFLRNLQWKLFKIQYCLFLKSFYFWELFLLILGRHHNSPFPKYTLLLSHLMYPMNSCLQKQTPIIDAKC